MPIKFLVVADVADCRLSLRERAFFRGAKDDTKLFALYLKLK